LQFIEPPFSLISVAVATRSTVCVAVLAERRGLFGSVCDAQAIMPRDKALPEFPWEQRH